MNESNVFSQIAIKDQERLRNYKDLLEFYQGKQWPGRERWGEKRLTLNYARIFVDKITSYLMAGMSFTVESVNDTPEDRTRAERAEKILTRIHLDNNLEQLDYETETDCAILGDACYKVIWDNEAKQVRITTPDIQGIYAWWMGDNLAHILRVASRYTLSTEEVEVLYGKDTRNKIQIPNNNQNPNFNIQISKNWIPDQVRNGITVVEVWTEKEFELYLDGSLIEKKANPYGFIPFIIFPDRMSQNL